METETKQKKFTGRQLRYLRGLGHHLKPLVIIGREGITANVISTVDAVLGPHELVKVKIGNGCPLERRQAAAAVAAGTGAEVIQIVGKTFLLFRENPKRRGERKIKLP